MKKYKFSPYLAVLSSFPQHPWEEWKFHNHKSRWASLDHQRLFLDSLAPKLKVSTMEDWYKVMQTDLIANGGIPHLVFFSLPLATHFCP